MFLRCRKDDRASAPSEVHVPACRDAAALSRSPAARFGCEAQRKAEDEQRRAEEARDQALPVKILRGKVSGKRQTEGQSSRREPTGPLGFGSVFETGGYPFLLWRSRSGTGRGVGDPPPIWGEPPCRKSLRSETRRPRIARSPLTRLKKDWDLGGIPPCGGQTSPESNARKRSSGQNIGTPELTKVNIHRRMPTCPPVGARAACGQVCAPRNRNKHMAGT